MIRSNRAEIGESDSELVTGVVTGILGQSWRATIAPWGDVIPWDGSPGLVWAIAAEDRWHFPDSETSVRQGVVRGTPVTETKVRVPSGDVVQRVWSASLREGTSAVLMEFSNDSPQSVAISLSRPDVVTNRPYHHQADSRRPWPSQDRGIERPPVVIPLGHRSTMRVALPRKGSVDPDDVDSFPSWESVASGWTRIAERASRLEIPDMQDGRPVGDVVQLWRCTVALDPPPVCRKPVEDVARWLVAHREIVRMGLESVEVPEVVSALERLLRHLRRGRTADVGVADALRSGAQLLGRSDARALQDFERALEREIEAVVDSRGNVARLLNEFARKAARDRAESGGGLDVVHAVESEFALWSDANTVTLVPDGFSDSRLGVDFEVHRLLAGPSHTISLAVRWHGERPAVIWEVEGPPGLLLRSGADPAWSSDAASGEALWSAPAASRARI